MKEIEKEIEKTQSMHQNDEKKMEEEPKQIDLNVFKELNKQLQSQQMKITIV